MAIIALSAVAAIRAQRVARIALSILWILLGTWCAEMEPQPGPAPALWLLSDGLLRTIEGTVTNAGPIRIQMDKSDDQLSADAPSQGIDLRLTSIEVVDDVCRRSQVMAPARESSLLIN